MKRITIVLLLYVVCFNIYADEGMWLPIHIERLNAVDMDKMGLQLTPEEIYDINQSSLKDAIVSMGDGFCTGEIISDQGLLLTNHHCAYDYIQSHSTIENDILTNGFWAQSTERELPNDGLFVRFLVRMEDVTDDILKHVKDDMSEVERTHKINEAIGILSREAKGDSHYDVEIKPFFEGNEYYLFVYEAYHDVRLVGAPPESIGKFGGDTDNWMWPRHTGDFSLFRVYAAPDGSPAHYAPENVPLKPKHHLPVSLDGVQENDFAMVMGYPGSTNRYLTSFGVNLALETVNPTRVNIRAKKLEVMKEFMDADPATRLAYASKYASISNYWKYFIGQSKGLRDLNVYAEKCRIEDEVTDWIQSKKSRIKQYGDPVAEIRTAYKRVEDISLPYYYHLEAGFGIEFVKQLYKLKKIEVAMETGRGDLDSIIKGFIKEEQAFFRDYRAYVDEKQFIEMGKLFLMDLDREFVPEVLLDLINSHHLDSTSEKVSISDVQVRLERLAGEIFSKSMLVNEEQLMGFYSKPDLSALKDDLGYQAAISIYESYKDISAKRGAALAFLNKGRRKFIAALQKMNEDQKYYPDANSTMRLSYGKVQSYNARDAVHFHYLTTIEGIMEKEDESNPEFVVPEKLQTLHRNRDYGQYAEDGELYVGFLTNNDITGGNSGSPVINSKGQLIGTAFDGNWEAMSGDIAFAPKLQRCINVDIRYVLFIIDKFAGAPHLIEEMTLIKNGSVQTSMKSR